MQGHLQNILLNQEDKLVEDNRWTEKGNDKQISRLNFGSHAEVTNCKDDKPNVLLPFLFPINFKFNMLEFWLLIRQQI